MTLKSSSDQQAMSEINVTPLVDVMLVLLVIFIVTAPLLMQAVPVNLPKTETTTPIKKNVQLKLSIDAKGHYFLDRRPVEPGALEEELRERKLGGDIIVQIDADQAVSYGSVAKALAIINHVDIRRVSFISLRR